MATIIVPFWASSTWWGLVVPDSAHLANEGVDWVWLVRSDPDLFASLGRRRAGGQLSRWTGHYWPSGLISRRPGSNGESPFATVASRAGAERAGADRGIDSGLEPNSGWVVLDVSRADPVEVELAADLQTSALSHVAGSTCRDYEG